MCHFSNNAESVRVNNSLIIYFSLFWGFAPRKESFFIFQKTRSPLSFCATVGRGGQISLSNFARGLSKRKWLDLPAAPPFCRFGPFLGVLGFFYRGSSSGHLPGGVGVGKVLGSVGSVNSNAGVGLDAGN